MKETGEIWIMRFNAWNQARAHLLTLQATISPLPANKRKFLWNEISTFMRRIDDALLNGRIPDGDRS